MTHKNDGFIENLMKVPAPLKAEFYKYMNFLRPFSISPPHVTDTAATGTTP